MKIFKVKKADSTVFQRIDGQAGKTLTATLNCIFAIQWIPREASWISSEGRS